MTMLMMCRESLESHVYDLAIHESLYRWSRQRHPRNPRLSVCYKKGRNSVAHEHILNLDNYLLSPSVESFIVVDVGEGRAGGSVVTVRESCYNLVLQCICRAAG